METRYWQLAKPDGSVAEYKRERSDAGLTEFVWKDNQWVPFDFMPILGWQMDADPNLTEISKPSFVGA